MNPAASACKSSMQEHAVSAEKLSAIEKMAGSFFISGNSSEHQRNEKSDYANLFAIG